MLSLHPENAVQLATQLHEERVDQAVRARRSARSRMISIQPGAVVPVARRSVGLVFVRIGERLLETYPSDAYARS